MRAAETLPGIRVETAPEAVRITLPRMDVAAFVGFAERGPCHIPVAVSSIAQFEAIFGGDAPLALDRKTGLRLRAQLPPTVRAFFANGGQRCWVVRVAATKELVETAASAGIALAAPPAQAGIFPIGGLLAISPSISGPPTVQPARLRASSLGSWSDSLRLSARLARHPLALAEIAPTTGGFSCLVSGAVAPGDLIELRAFDGATTAYAKAVRISGRRMLGTWLAAFQRAPNWPSSTAVLVELGDGSAEAGQVDQNGSLLLEAAASKLRLGGWAGFTEASKHYWMRVDRLEAGSASGAVWQQIKAEAPPGPLSAARLAVDLREYDRTTARTHAGLGLAPESRMAIQQLVDADRFYADPDNRAGAIGAGVAVTCEEVEGISAAYGVIGDPRGFNGIAERLGTADFGEADHRALGFAWIPLGLEEKFTSPAGPLDEKSDPVVRDGLAAIDDWLFIDPRLVDGEAPTIAARAQAISTVREAPLFGIHALLAAGTDLFIQPSLLAVPDAAQPDWAEAGKDSLPDLSASASAPPSWSNHSGGCAAAGDGTSLTSPDQSRFLDCSTRLLPAPIFEALGEVAPETAFELSWSAQPLGAVAILEESARPDFAVSAEIWRGSASSLAIHGKREGLYFYRLRIELDGNRSAWTPIAVAVRGSRFDVGMPNPDRTGRLHVAMLRLAGGTGDLFAILSLPQSFRTAEAIDYARRLGTLAPGAGDRGRLGSHEERLLSYGALYHPWLVEASGAGLASLAADGAIAGLMANRARERGAWVAPANDNLADIVGLEMAFPDAELIALDHARVNPIRKLGIAFAPQDALTLSGERDWTQINVRRLMILLRRLAMQRGMTYLFEPNGPILRRAVERELAATLDYLQVRGAFAGQSSAQSYRIAVQSEPTDADAGRFTVALAVAPAQPLKFLALRLIRRGDGVTLVEEA